MFDFLKRKIVLDTKILRKKNLEDGDKVFICFKDCDNENIVEINKSDVIKKLRDDFPNCEIILIAGDFDIKVLSKK